MLNDMYIKRCKAILNSAVYIKDNDLFARIHYGDSYIEVITEGEMGILYRNMLYDCLKAVLHLNLKLDEIKMRINITNTISYETQEKEKIEKARINCLRASNNINRMKLEYKELFGKDYDS